MAFHIPAYSLSLLFLCFICVSTHSYENYVNDLFHKFDSNQDSAIDQEEFTRFFLSLFTNEEKPYVPLGSCPKIFALLDMDNDHRLNAEEFRKIFKHWTHPLMSPKSCLFLCLPSKFVSQADLENATTRAILQAEKLFELHHVYLASCHVDSRVEQTEKLLKHIQQTLPKVYGIKVYDLDSHLDSIINKDFDQFVISLANIEHDANAFDALLSLNSVHQHPTVFIVDGTRFDSDYLHEPQMHSSIVVSPTMSIKPQERVRYKMNMATILARKVYRKYKQHN